MADKLQQINSAVNCGKSGGRLKIDEFHRELRRRGSNESNSQAFKQRNKLIKWSFGKIFEKQTNLQDRKESGPLWKERPLDGQMIIDQETRRAFPKSPFICESNPTVEVHKSSAEEAATKLLHANK